jgi:acylphosphatase
VPEVRYADPSAGLHEPVQLLLPQVPARAAPGPLVTGPDEVEAPGATGDAARLTAWLTGRVQGVGMRWWVRARALELGLSGHAANLADGRVEVVAEGPWERCADLLALLVEEPTRARRPGHVRAVTHRRDAPRGVPPGFVER